MALTPEQAQKAKDNLAKARAAKALKAAPIVTPVLQRKVRAQMPVEALNDDDGEIIIDDSIVFTGDTLPQVDNIAKSRLTEEEKELLQAISERGKGQSRRFKATDEQPDPKYIPPHLIPDGWSFEWKTISVMGQPIEELRPGYLSDLEQNCWEPVPAGLIRSRLPQSYSLKTVDIGGQRLMMRPKYLTEEAQKEYKALAQGRLKEQTKALQSTPDGELERRVHTVRRSYEPISVPDEV